VLTFADVALIHYWEQPGGSPLSARALFVPDTPPSWRPIPGARAVLVAKGLDEYEGSGILAAMFSYQNRFVDCRYVLDVVELPGEGVFQLIGHNFCDMSWIEFPLSELERFQACRRAAGFQG
jgi:hypothetical protein